MAESQPSQNLVAQAPDPPAPKDAVIEEYRQLVAERRFVMTSYMQALGLCLTLSGFALVQLIGAGALSVRLMLAVGGTVLNVVAIFATARFRSMALHALRRETALARSWGLQEPHSLIWGYQAGLIVVAVSQSAMVSIIVFGLQK